MPNLAPEPYRSGALYLLYRVALFLRNNADQITTEQLSDLGNAIHNVPESLTEYGPDFDERLIRELYLAVYDRRWVQSPADFSLVRSLDDGIARARQWRGSTAIAESAP